MWKTVLNIVIALVIIGVGAGAGWLIANTTNPNPTTTVAAATATTATSPANTTPAAGTTPSARPSNAPAGGAVGTPAAGSTVVAGAGTTPAAGAGQGNRQQTSQLAGTIESFDATAKKLVITTIEGSKTLMTTNARFTKAAKVTTEELTQLATGPLLITGEKGADGSYTARSITVVDTAGGAGAGGFGGGAGATAPGGGAGAGGAAGGRNATANTLILPTSTFKDGVLTGQTVQGEAVKVIISAETSMTKQSAGTESDLKAGVTITATTRPNAPEEALLVTINA